MATYYWTSRRSGQRLGPVSGEQLIGLASAGTLLPDDLVWTDGMAAWAPAAQVAGLFPVRASPPSLPAAANDASALAPVVVNGRTLRWRTISGVVVGSRKYSTTYVGSSGSGKNLRFSSTTVVTTEFFVRQADGTESPYSFTREDILVSDGQRVTLVHGDGPGAGTAWMLLVNHDARQWQQIQTPVDFFYKTRLFSGVGHWYLWCCLLAAPLTFLVLLTCNPFGPLGPNDDPVVVSALSGAATGALVALVPWFVVWIVQHMRIDAAWRSFEPRLKAVADHCLRSPPYPLAPAHDAATATDQPARRGPARLVKWVIGIAASLLFLTAVIVGLVARADYSRLAEEKRKAEQAAAQKVEEEKQAHEAVEHAVYAIREAGGAADVEADGTVRITRLAALGPELLKSLNRASAVGVSGEELTDENLALLKSITPLRELNLANNKYLTDAGLAHVGGMKNLTTLSFSGTGVTDTGLARLDGLSRLEVLDLNFTHIGDAGLRSLKGLKGLRVLGLNYTRVTDQGMADLAGFTGLESLSLWTAERITDAGVLELKKLPRLSHLVLTDDKITDETLDVLIDMKSLREVSLGGTKVTQAGLQRLAKARPDLTVDMHN